MLFVLFLFCDWSACDEDGDGEGSRIVAIQSVSTPEDLVADTQGSFQVCSVLFRG